MKPSYKKPYYYLHNVNINTEVPTNPITQISYILIDTDSVVFDPNVTYYTLVDGTYTPFTGSAFESETQYYVAVVNNINGGTDSPNAEYNVSPTNSETINAISDSDGHVVGEGVDGDVFNLPRTVNMLDNKKASLVEKPTA
jgi:hypothetical protein